MCQLTYPMTTMGGVLVRIMLNLLLKLVHGSIVMLDWIVCQSEKYVPYGKPTEPQKSSALLDKLSK